MGSYQKQDGSQASTFKPPSPRDLADRKRADGQSEKILAMLSAAGEHGCTNHQLWTVCHAVNSRVSDLRKQGHRITAWPEGHGIWRYRLQPAPDQASPFEQTRREELEREAPLFACVGAR
jgi:hypothetical protein